MFYLYILTLLEFYIILKLTRNHKYNVQISLISALLFFLYLKKTNYSSNLEGFEDIEVYLVEIILNLKRLIMKQIVNMDI